MKNLAPAIFPPKGIGDAKPGNKAVLDWVHEIATLTQPENIFWCDGSERENEFLIAESLKQNVLIELNQKKVPRSYLHRSNPNDVARVEQFTFVCTPTKQEAGPTNNWSDPTETYAKLRGLLAGAMRGRTMFVIPYMMGPADSPLTKVGFEITDSKYVVLSMRIMTRMGEVALRRLGDDPNAEWNRGVHSLLDVNPERRFICHFPQDNTIISVGSGYGGNVLLSKKCLALRIGSYLARKQGWMAEHMLILGVESPEGRKTLRRGCVPQRMRQDEFRDAHSARAFQRLEGHDDWRRHRLDANSRRPFIRGQSGERLFRRRARDELQIESERDAIDRARHNLYQRGSYRRR